MRFFRDSDQSGSPEATGHNGFYYHFLDLRTGKRVWLSELSMVDRQIPVSTFTVPMHDVDRAIAESEDVGFVKIHVKGRTDRILGATIVAGHAGEMISEITLAIVARIGLRTLALVVHAYPTRADAIRKAADACVQSLPKRAEPSRSRR